MQLPDNLLKSSIDRGDIMHADVFAGIDHGKFFVVLGTVDSEVGVFFINSNVNPFIQRRPEMLDMQLPLRPADYNFLNHTSFLNATVIHRLDIDTLVSHIQNGRCKRVGTFSADDMHRLLSAAQSSRLFTEQEKSTFLQPQPQS